MRTVLFSALTAMLVLAGCGTTPTRYGAAPYAEPPTTAPVRMLTFRVVPHLVGAEARAVERYQRFQTAYSRTLRTHRVAPALGRLAYPSVRAQVAAQVAGSAGLPAATPTLIRIDGVSAAGTAVGLVVCAVTSQNRLPFNVLMNAEPGTRWRVSGLAWASHRRGC